MVGVFDPKAEPIKKKLAHKKALAASAVVAFTGIVGVFLTLSNQFAASPKSDAELVLTKTDSGQGFQSDPLASESPIVLTSFEELHENKETDIRRDSLKQRDTLTDLLDRLGVERQEANSALYALYDDDLIDPRKVRPGLELAAYVEEDATEENPDRVRLVGLTLKHEKEASLIVSRNAEGRFDARELHTRQIRQTRRVTGNVSTSLYEAALHAGAHDAQVYDFAQIFAYDVDFQREMRVGDAFEIVFEEYTDEKGRFVRSGEIVYAELEGNAVDRGFYKFTPSDDGIPDYYDAHGQSARKFLMKTPINGARLSSSFGFRRHPISGYNKLHKGTDFAAPTGTPIYAAGNGVVERASRYGGYGKYVRIQHANGYETAYAHMSRYGPGVKKGKRIKQGDIVGYVGSTGASTGPHLHYEVIKNGKHVNAMTLKLPTGRKLEGQILVDFEKARSQIDAFRFGRTTASLETDEPTTSQE